MKKTLLFLLSFASVSVMMAQQKSHWKTHTSTEKIVTDKAVARLSFPTDFKLFDLNLENLRQDLFTVVDNRQAHTTVIMLPNAEGNVEAFEVYEASNFEPALQARFPEIRAFSGKGLTDKYATLKLSISPQGIQTMVFRTDKPNEFIEPYSADHTTYAVFKSQRNPGQLPWKCNTPEQQLSEGLNNQVSHAGLTSRSGGDLKTMRLAQSCNAEYSNYFGATSASQVGLVLAAFNNTLTRCNGVYERDLALHLNLISNTTSVIYYTASSDPYTTLSNWNSQLQSTLTSVIGEANYDIGHMFGASGGGGNAGCIGCVCTNGSKGSGITSPADGIPQGDNFDIDYVVHEVGHQLGANHTFSMTNEGTGVNMEPGSGITIMGYAGITSQDMASHSIDIYHAASINQIQTNLASKTCPVTTSIAGNNATPVVNALSNYTIPKSTPFALTGSASDADGDALTYCWEQYDNASTSQTGASSVASATKASGPNWITFSPTTSPTRYFPRLSSILAGSLTTGPLTGGDTGATSEALSSVARTLNFRLTVRDNAPYSSTAPVKVGQTQYANMTVTVSSASGPFAVSAPNTAVSYAGGSTQTITWSVASTTAAPVSCANVKISLSTDGGQTFPTVLAASTPNDGTEDLVIPNTPTTTARIKVEAVGNIFFDISNANFTITAGASCGDPTGLTSSAIGDNTATISWNAVSGANSYSVDYKLNSSGTWTNFATAQTATTANLTGLVQGSLYDWRVRATCTAGTGNYATAQFTTTAPFVCNAPSGLAASGITSSGATVSWSAVSGAASYAVDYKLNTDVNWTPATASTTSTSVAISGLVASSLYDYRVSTNCGANGSSGFSAAQFTTTAASTCGTAFEPNESTAAAALITSGVVNSAAITTSTDNDYFKITTTATSNIVYNLVGPSGVDFDLTVLNSSGTQIGSSAGTTATETITLNNQAAGTYYIRVYGYSGAFSATCYTIKATATTVTSCVSTYDNSTNNTANNSTTNAPVIPFNTNITGQISTGGDVDNYKFVITTGGTITLTLTTLPANYNLRLVNSAGSVITTSSNSGTNNESISYTAAAGTYYARVYATNSSTFNATSCYTLKVQLGTATRPEDPSIKVEPSMVVYPNPVQQLLNINLSGIDGISEIAIFNTSGVQVIRQRANTGRSAVDVSALPAGVYMIKAYNGKAELSRSKFVKY